MRSTLSPITTRQPQSFRLRASTFTKAGWVVAEVGRQPWAIQDLLPVGAAVSQISPSGVITTFFLFLLVFTVLLVAEVKIMCKAISQHKA